MSICLVAGFFAFSYAIRSLAPEASPWTPLTNFLLQTWFLWLGFYNFYLAMVLSPFLIGFYIRHASKLTTRRASLMAARFIALFLPHLIPTTLPIVTLIRHSVC